MTTDPVLVALDIGTSHTTALVVAVHGDVRRSPVLKVLGVGRTRTLGLRRGVVSDIEEATRSIRKAVDDAVKVAGVTPDSLYVGIAGEHVRAMSSTGVVAISGEEIQRADVDRVNEVARAMAIPQDRELLHAIPQEYRVDKAEGIRDPVGMIGTRLALRETTRLWKSCRAQIRRYSIALSTIPSGVSPQVTVRRGVTFFIRAIDL